MKKWDKYFHSDVSDEYKKRVMSAADDEFSAMKTTSKILPWYMRWQFVGAMAGVVYLFLNVEKQKRNFENSESDFYATEDNEMLEDLDLFEDLDLIETLNEETGELDS